MNTFRMVIKRGIAVAVCVLALLTLAMLLTETSFAAGSHKVTIKYDQSQGETTYDLYYMGTFGENGKFVFANEDLEKALGDPPNYKKEDYEEEGKSEEEVEKEWTDDWMKAAFAAYEYVTKDGSGIDPVASVTTSDKQFTFPDAVEDGFYLVTGSSVRTVDEKGKVTYTWPMPMYVRVLNEDVTYSLKPDTGVAQMLRVEKKWVGDEEVKEKVRSKKITIHIAYDGQAKEDVDLPIKDAQGNEQWWYQWETEQGEDDPTKWSVTEVDVDEGYSVDISPKFVPETGFEILTVTNTYEDTELEIVKKMAEYINQGSTKQTFVFKVEGFAGELKMFTKYVGATFGINDDEETALVKNIPGTISRVVVTETYKGNYKPDQETKEAVFEDGKWTCTFTNTKDTDKPTFNTGVINQYSITGDGVFSFQKSKGSGVE